MTTAETGDRPSDAPGVHTAVADLHGRMLLGLGAPLAGKERFVERVLQRADAASRDTLHVAASRGYDRLAPPLPDGTYVVDCSPAPSGRADRVTDVATPSDLTGIGMPVSRFLERTGPRPVVTLDSISTLLAYSDQAAVFRFLAVLAAQLRQSEGVGVFLMEDGCHDPQVVSTFQQLFDGRLDVEPGRARIRGLDDVSPGWAPW